MRKKTDNHLRTSVDLFFLNWTSDGKTMVVLLWNFIWCEEIDELILSFLGMLVAGVNFLFDLFLWVQ